MILCNKQINTELQTQEKNEYYCVVEKCISALWVNYKNEFIGLGALHRRGAVLQMKQNYNIYIPEAHIHKHIHFRYQILNLFSRLIFFCSCKTP